MLEVEDGTGKPNAQTYVSLEEARQFAAARGVPLPDDDTAAEAMVILATDFIESNESRMKGRRATSTQALSYPRTGVRIGCEYDEYPSDKIPANLAHAQCHAIVAQAQGMTLMPNFDPSARLVKRRKTDVLETEYFGPAELGTTASARPIFPIIVTLLAPLLRAGGASAPAYRV